MPLPLPALNNSIEPTRRLPRWSRHSDLTVEGVRMARIVGPRKAYRYSAEFKLKAAELSQIEGARLGGIQSAPRVPAVISPETRV